jgi:cytochrome c-type biogenesis protein CcmH/NrfF
MQTIRWKKPRTLLFVAGLWLCLVSSLNSQTLLNPAQQRRAGYLYTEFIAPCCWRQSVAIHQSEESMKVRSEIDSKILLGDSDSQIKAALVKEYGHGILMEPEGIRAFLAYSLPILAFALGLLAVVNWIRSQRQNNPENPRTGEVSAGPLPDLEFDW